MKDFTAKDYIKQCYFSKNDYFAAKYGCLYKTYSISEIDVEKLFNEIQNNKNFKCLTSGEKEGDTSRALDLLLFPEDENFTKHGIFETIVNNSPAIISLSSTGFVEITISNEKTFDEFKELFNFIKRYTKSSVGKVYIFLSDGPNVYLESIDVEQTNTNILDNYNDDFEPIHNKIVSHLETTKKGIILLHGEPGSGKTYYLRYLTNIIKKKFVWLPAEMSGKMTTPDFLSILKEKCKNSILILEDSEKYLQKRESALETSMYISNILNITDGMMSDVLKIQLICTFNCDESFIDPAILRSGRLIEKYKFDKLNINKAKNLALKLNKNIVVTSNTVLSDIYNAENIPEKDKPQQFIGFGSNK